MTQQELSALAGVPASTISKMEKGVYGSSGDRYVEALAEALDTPISYFSDEPLPDVPDGRFRKQQRASAKLQKSVVAHAKQVADVMRVADARYRIHKTTLVPMERGDDLDRARDIAQNLRGLLGLAAEGPVGNMTRACERAGVAVANLCPFGPGQPAESTRHFSAFSAWPDMGMGSARPVIIVSSTLPGDVQRSTIAHEVAHLYAHTRNPAVPDEVAERQAWMIGGYLVVPPADADEILGGSHVTLDMLRRVKSAYGVSVKFLITYCERHGVITRERSTALHKQYSSRKWHRKEPLEVTRETARLFPDVVRRMRADGVDVGMSHADVMEIVSDGDGTRGLRLV